MVNKANIRNIMHMDFPNPLGLFVMRPSWPLWEPIGTLRDRVSTRPVFRVLIARWLIRSLGMKKGQSIIPTNDWFAWRLSAGDPDDSRFSRAVCMWWTGDLYQRTAAIFLIFPTAFIGVRLFARYIPINSVTEMTFDFGRYFLQAGQVRWGHTSEQRVHRFCNTCRK